MELLTDIGANLTHSSFSNDLTVVIENAKKMGVNRLIITGSSVKESQMAYQLTQDHYGLFSTAGVHPHNAKSYNYSSYNELLDIANKPTVVAIGECGLDYWRNFSTKQEQKDVFSIHLDLSIETSLPLFLHQRDAFNDFINILQPYKNKIPGGVSHCFTGNKNELHALLDLGLFVGITGWLCDPKRGKDLRDAIKYIPLDRILIETDSPYLLPKDMKDKPKSRRNEPKYLAYILEKLSDMIKVDKESLAEQIEANVENLFKINRVNAIHQDA